jgi:hypothetical protein
MGAVRRGLMFNGCILANLIDDIVYMHFTQSSIYKKGRTTMPTVNCLIVGYWAQDGKLCDYPNSGLKHNFIISNSISDMWSQIIKAFSFEGQTVLIIRYGAEPG